MADLERFGNYLLLKKLDEDPLGESFRAGRVAGEELEEVVFLRVFNGQGIARDRLAAALEERGDLSRLLTGSAAVAARDLGVVAGTPFAAWDYVAGRTLGTVLELGKREQLPLPTDHALLIAERLALALAEAEDTRHGSERLLHGFPVPPLVTLSAEGEVRLTGFEIGPGLRQMAIEEGPLATAFGAYLSPEARGGEPADRSDTTWSLGTLVYQLLTGETPTTAPPDLATARLVTDSAPLPAELTDLLRRSLTARDGRIADAATWHRELDRIMAEGDYSPTTFNLAFYMHSLLRDSIEQDARELEAERQASRQALAAGSTATTQPSAAPPPTAAEAGAAAASSAGSSKGLWIGAGAVVVALAIGLGGWWYLSRQTADAETPTEVADTSTTGRSTGTIRQRPGAALPTTEPTAAEAARAVSEAQAAAEAKQQELAELEERMMEMLNQRTQEMGQEIQQEYAQRLESLQGQLEEARRQAAEREEALKEQRRRQAAAAQRAAEVAEEAEATEEGTAGEEEGSAEAPQEAVASATGEADPAGEEAAAAREPAPTQTGQRPRPPAETTTRQPAQPPAPPAVQEGDLVELTADVTPPRLLSQPDPQYPPIARRLGREATIQLRLLVDENGRVIQIERLGRTVGMGFEEEATGVARGTVWRPATKDGVKVRVWVPFSVRFQL